MSPGITELMAIAAAASFGAASVALKQGFRYASPLASSLVVLAVNVALFGAAAVIFVSPSAFFTPATLFFAIGGLLGQALARTLQYTGIDKVGPARNHAVLGAVPLFSAGFSVVILKEKLTLALLIGMLLIILGVWYLASERKRKGWKRIHLLFPLAGASLYGLAAIFQKMGLSLVQNSVAAVAVGATVALVAVSIFSAQRKKSVKVGKALPFFLAGGFFNSGALFLSLEALGRGTVTAVMPLVATQALFAALWSFLFLKEKITKNVLVGALLVIAGASLITLL